MQIHENCFQQAVILIVSTSNNTQSILQANSYKKTTRKVLQPSTIMRPLRYIKALLQTTTVQMLNVVYLLSAPSYR